MTKKSKGTKAKRSKEVEELYAKLHSAWDRIPIADRELVDDEEEGQQ